MKKPRADRHTTPPVLASSLGHLHREEIMRKISQAVPDDIPATKGPPLQTVIGRVAAILLGNAGNNIAPKSGLSQREMALQLETSWEQVNKSLRYLHEEGAIRIERHRITIKELSLREIAGGHFS